MSVEVVQARQQFDGSWPQRALVWLVSLKIAGLLLLFDAGAIQAFDLPKSIFSRAVAWLIAAVLVVSVLRFGPRVLPRTGLHIAVASFLVANALSGAVAENRYLAIFGDRDRYLGLTFLIDMALLYLAVAVGFRAARDWAVLGLSAAAALFIAILYGLGQFFGFDPISWTDDPRDRPFSTFGSPDHFGHALSVALGGSVGVAAFSRGPHARLWRGGAATLALLVLLTSAVVATRGTIVALTATLAVLPLVYARLEPPNKRKPFALAGGLAAALLFIAVVVLFSPVGERFGETTEDGGSGRVRIYTSALQAFAERPLLGYGPDNFAVAYPRYRELPPEGPGDPQSSAHNWILQTAATTGVVGLAAQFAMLLAFVWTLWTRGLQRMPSLMAAVLLAAVGYWTHALLTVGAIAVDAMGWLCLGGIAATVGDRLTDRERPVNRIIIAAIFLVAALGSVSGVRALAASRDAASARDAWISQDRDRAVLAATSAVLHDPGRADYWNWLGLANDALGAWRGAGDAYDEAAMRAPHDSTYWANLALSRARQATQDHDGAAALSAVRAAQEAVIADPRGWRAHGVLTEVAYSLGYYDLALRAAVSTFILHKGAAGHEEGIAVASAPRVSDSAAARETLGRALAVKRTPRLHVALANLALSAGDRDEAQMHARGALELEPGNVDAQRVLAAASR
jgi:O-antigen ligase